MTLQYRIQSKYEDEQWRQRRYLCDKLLSQTIDAWCQSDAAFPTQSVVAGILYLFSPRCKPFEVSPYQLREQLGDVVRTPEDEYQRAWPGREESRGKALIASLSGIIAAAVETWTDQGVGEPSRNELAERLAEEMVAQQYVVFHHYQSTRRDVNPWGI